MRTETHVTSGETRIQKKRNKLLPWLDQEIYAANEGSIL